MNKQYNAITMRRVWDTNTLYTEVEGTVSDWPPWAARAVVSVVAQWRNDGFSRHFRDVDGVVVEHIGEDAGGHDVVRVVPAITNGPCYRVAGAAWQTALEAVLMAQRED